MEHPTPTSTAACTPSPTRPPKPMKRRAKACARLINAASAVRDRLHQGRHRGDQPRRLVVRPVAAGRRRDRALGDGAPRQHRALALPARAPGRGAEVHPGHRRRRLDLAAYRALLGPRTRMVAVSHMSNVLGTVNPVAEIIAAAHAAGAADADRRGQAVVHGTVDVQALDADFYAFSGHKLYGPTGIGALYGKAERLAALPPYQGGGEMIGQRDAGRDHLCRPAAPVRGRHAADPRGHRPRRGHRLAGDAGPRRRRRARARALSTG